MLQCNKSRKVHKRCSLFTIQRYFVLRYIFKLVNSPSLCFVPMRASGWIQTQGLLFSSRVFHQLCYHRRPNAGNPYRKGRLSKIDLLVPTSLDQQLLTVQKLPRVTLTLVQYLHTMLEPTQVEPLTGLHLKGRVTAGKPY